MKNIHKINVNTYITNEEEIKKGDWFLEKAGRQYPIQWNSKEKLNFHCKKIILTTDQSLEGVQVIDDEFLEWFIKNPSCESVDVNYELGSCLNCEWNYDSCPNSEECLKSKYNIIIPKEEPKNVVLGYKTSENFYYGTDEFGTYRKIYYKDKEQTLYTEQQVREAIRMSRREIGYFFNYEFREDVIIQSLKPKKY
jgi:hypothetical protein